MMVLGGNVTMSIRRRHPPEQVIRKLRAGERLTGQGRALPGQDWDKR